MILMSIWHRFWYKYNLELFDSCMDKEMKLKLLHKAQYHEQRLNFS
ncbi:hypothetical protein J2X61_000080 [Bacillus sp. 3255]|nr:hypothetical protein [Bacillus sp. 3255]